MKKKRKKVYIDSSEFDENKHSNFNFINQININKDISDDEKNIYDDNEKEFSKEFFPYDKKNNESKSTEVTENKNKNNMNEFQILQTKDNIICNKIKMPYNHEQKNFIFQNEAIKQEFSNFNNSQLYDIFEEHNCIKYDHCEQNINQNIFLFIFNDNDEFINLIKKKGNSKGDIDSDENIRNKIYFIQNSNNNSNNNNINYINNLKKNNNDNNNKIFNIKKIKKIELTVYNIDTFNNNYLEIKNNIQKYSEKKLFTLKEIIINYEEVIIQLINKGIFENKYEIEKYEKMGKIYNNILFYLINNKNKKEKKNKNENNNKERNLDHDEMSNRIKTGLFQAILEILNSFDEMKNNPIGKLSKNIIYTQTKADFNLGIFIQSVCSIFANHSNEGDNYNIIYRIIYEYNEKKEHESLYEFLYFIIQDCFDIYRYMKIDSKKLFKTKFGDYLIKVYNDLNFENNEKKKDYIVSFILLTYNLERYYAIKPIRNKKKTFKLMNKKI